MEDRITQWLNKNEAQSRLTHMEKLHGGISSSMFLFETYSPLGPSRKRILRIPNSEKLALSPYAAQEEYDILRLVSRGGITAPVPCFLDPDGSSFGQPAIVLEYIDGEVNLKPVNVNAYLADFAQQLSAIHALRISPVIKERLRHCQIETPELTQETLAALEERFPCNAALDALQQAIPLPKTHEEAFLHGDLWPGNVLWKNNALVGIIDWEEPAWGDPLFDLAICRLEFYWLFGKSAADDFTNMYLKNSSVSVKNLPYWDLYACFRAGHQMAHWCTVYPKLGRPDITESYMEDIRRGFAINALQACHKQ